MSLQIGKEKCIQVEQAQSDSVLKHQDALVSAYLYYKPGKSSLADKCTHIAAITECYCVLQKCSRLCCTNLQP